MKKSSRSTNYFGKETEQYIIEFNSTDDPEKKQKIFTEHLYYPFYKLAECIIHTFKFYHTDVDQLEDLKCDIVRMIYEEKLDKFDPSLGAKAYSYFGTIIKRWLIAYNIKNYNLKKKLIPVSNFCESALIEDKEPDITEGLSLSDFMDLWISDVSEKLEELFLDKKDRIIADAVLTVFKTRQDLDIFSKKALYVYLREITGYETVYLTKVILQLKESFYSLYNKFQELGIVADREE